MNELNAQPKMEQQVQQVLHEKGVSAPRKYAVLTVGGPSVWGLIKYEVITGICSWVPGAVGFALRRCFYRFLFQSFGRGVMIGCNVTLRGAGKIKLGDHVLLDDNTVLDARGPDAHIELGRHVVVSRNTIVRTRGRQLTIGDESDIGCNCIIATDSTLVIGKKVLIAAYVYITAGGNHNHSDPDRAILDQGFTSEGGSAIGDDVWLGAHSTIMDGVTVGDGTVVGAHSLVNKSLPPFCIAYGVPAVEKGHRGAE